MNGIKISDLKRLNLQDLNSYRNTLTVLHKFLQVKQSLGEHWFFDEIELTEEYQEIDFNFSASNISIINDSNYDVIFSWDGTIRAGLLHSNEELQLDSLERDKIFIKGQNKIRIWAFS